MTRLDAATASAAPAAADVALLFDMHCHLDFIENANDFAALAEVCGITSLSNTVTPADYRALKDTFASTTYAHLALGAHPWWIADGRIDEAGLALFEKLAVDARFIGEVGLDFTGERAKASVREAQIAAFERILAACESGKVISLHANGAESTLLDLLEHTGATQANDCILHWYSGPSDQLKRALDLGCYFSVGKRMLKTKRGCEYARIIPLERLLLESDMPSRESTRYTPAQWNADLTEALLMLCETRNITVEEVLETIQPTSARMLHL